MHDILLDREIKKEHISTVCLGKFYFDSFMWVVNSSYLNFFKQTE